MSRARLVSKKNNSCHRMISVLAPRYEIRRDGTSIVQVSLFLITEIFAILLWYDIKLRSGYWSGRKSIRFRARVRTRAKVSVGLGSG